MTTKEYLGQISRLNRMINNKLVEIAQLKELACSVSAIQTGERVQTTPNYDKIGTAYAKIDEMERVIKSQTILYTHSIISGFTLAYGDSRRLLTWS